MAATRFWVGEITMMVLGEAGVLPVVATYSSNVTYANCGALVLPSTQYSFFNARTQEKIKVLLGNKDKGII